MKSSLHLRASYLRRGRLFGLLSVILAPAWYFVAYRVFRDILHLEFVAIMSLALGAGMGAGADNSGGQQSINPGVVEGTAHIWLVLMCAAGTVTFLGGVVGLLARPSGRRWLLAAGISILASTLLTLAGMWVLIRWGGFPPTVKPLGYLVIALVQSFYGWVLLAAFLRKPRPVAQLLAFGASPIDKPTPEHARGLR